MTYTHARAHTYTRSSHLEHSGYSEIGGRVERRSEPIQRGQGNRGHNRIAYPSIELHLLGSHGHAALEDPPAQVGA